MLNNEKEKTRKHSKKEAKLLSGTHKNYKIDGYLFKDMVRCGAEELRRKRQEINQLNVFPVPDGDTGDNMSMTMDSGIRAIEDLDTNDLSKVIEAFSHGTLLGARGNSGVILSQFFKGIAKGVENLEIADTKTLAEAFKLGVKYAYETVMTPIEGTILTVAREAVEYAISKSDFQTSIKTFFSELRNGMHNSLERTPQKLPILKEAEVVDSGGAGLLSIIEGFNKILNTKNTYLQQTSVNIFNKNIEKQDNLVFPYCTELLLELSDAKCSENLFSIESIKTYLSKNGDSVSAIQSENLVKIHIHTFTPENILFQMHKYGEFLTIKIENMTVQHNSFKNSSNKNQENKFNSNTAKSNDSENDAQRKKYGIIAVASAQKIEEEFKKLGTDVVIRADNGITPSSKDFLDAIKKTKAQIIFIFPNNKNIYLPAEQAASLEKNSIVIVIKSTSIGVGYCLLNTIDFKNKNYQNSLEKANNNIQKYITAYISTSIKSIKINGVNIKKGEYIGVVEKDIICSEKSINSAAIKILKEVIKNRNSLSVFLGKEINEETIAKLKKSIKSYKKDIRINFINSGQPVQHLIFVAE